MKKLKIFCVNCSLEGAFRAMGHEVRSARPAPGIYNAAELLPRNFEPDVFLQQEELSKRVILKNLHEAGGIKAFWSIDTHLNIYWQKHYGRCFDIFFTPHISFYRNMPDEWRHGAMRRLPMHGYELGFVPHAQRAHALGFAGVLDDSRPIRKNMVNLLGRSLPLALRSGLPFAQLLDFYSQSRILANESICHEVNFRITEGASAGCCVLSQNIGEDLEALYTPGEDVIVFDDGRDLVEKAVFLHKRAGLAERVGQNARRRTLERHMPRHRAEEVLAACAVAAPGAPEGRRQRALFRATLAQMARHGDHVRDKARFAAEFESCLDDGDDLWGAYVIFLSTFFSPPEVREHWRRLRACGRDTGFEGCFALAAHALKAEDAALFAEAYELLRPGAPRPGSMHEAALLLADAAEERGRFFQPGFNVRPGRATPETAMEILALALSRRDGDAVLMDRMSALAARSRAYAWFRLGLLARKSLERGQDWRARLEYGLECLACLKVREGLEEIAAAEESAQRLGAMEEFRALAGKAAGRLVPADG